MVWNEWGTQSDWKGWGQPGGNQGRLTFQAFNADSGYTALPQTFTLGTQSLTATAIYRAENAGAGSWTATVGSDLSIAGSGTAPTTAQAAPFTDSTCQSVTFNDGKSYTATDATTNEFGTSDFILECVFQAVSTAADEGLCGKYSAAPHVLLYNHNNNLAFIAAGVSNPGIAPLTSGAWYHALVVAKRGNKLYVRLNGGLTFSGNCNTTDLSNSVRFEIGGYNTTTTPSNQRVAYVGLFIGSMGSITSTDVDNMALSRLSKLCGVYPQVAASPIPTHAARSTTAYLDVDDGTGTRTLFSVGSNWPRVVKRLDTNSAVVKGYFPERGTTNLCLQSQNLSTTGAIWSASNNVLNSATTAPDGTATAQPFIASAGTNSPMGRSQAITLTAASYTASCFVKAGGKTICWLGDFNTTDGYAWFNLSTGAVGTAQAGVTARIESFGGGWYRPSITFTGTAASHTLGVFASDADNSTSCTGDAATTSLTVWGYQVEATNVATSYVPTTSASVARGADDLRFAATGNVNGSRATIASTLLMPSVIATGSGQIITLGTTSSDAIFLSVNSNGKASFSGTSSNISQFAMLGSTSLNDGAKHTVRGTYAANDFHQYVDGSADGTADTSGTVPSFGNQLDVGMREVLNIQASGVISNLRFWAKPIPATASNP